MGYIIGIDVGGSTTKIVGFKADKSGSPKKLIEPQFVKQYLIAALQMLAK